MIYFLHIDDQPLFVDWIPEELFLWLRERGLAKGFLRDNNKWTCDVSSAGIIGYLLVETIEDFRTQLEKEQSLKALLIDFHVNGENIMPDDVPSASGEQLILIVTAYPKEALAVWRNQATIIPKGDKNTILSSLSSVLGHGA